MDFEIDFMDVGDSHGDAICIRYGNPYAGYSVDVIDGGYSDTGEQIVRHLRQYWNTNVINNLSLSHGDTDHATGLIKVMEACQVITLRMNMPWLYVNEIPFEYFHGNLRRQGFVEQSRRENQYLVELERMAQRNGYTRILPIFQGDTFGCFTVLAPSRQRYISLIPELKGPEAVNMPDSYAPRRGQNAPDASYESWDYETLQEFPTPPTSASNETSVVQLARFGDYHALFTGDVGPHGLTEAAVYAYQSGIYRRPNLFQIPHQGSRHNVTPTALDVWLGTQVPQGSPIRGVRLQMLFDSLRLS